MRYFHREIKFRYIAVVSGSPTADISMEPRAANRPVKIANIDETLWVFRKFDRFIGICVMVGTDMFLRRNFSRMCERMRDTHTRSYSLV